MPKPETDLEFQDKKYLLEELRYAKAYLYEAISEALKVDPKSPMKEVKKMLEQKDISGLTDFTNKGYTSYTPIITSFLQAHEKAKPFLIEDRPLTIVHKKNIPKIPSFRGVMRKIVNSFC